MDVKGIGEVPFHSMKLYRGADVHILSFLTSEIDVGDW
jgi:hypothetical protein